MHSIVEIHHHININKKNHARLLYHKVYWFILYVLNDFRDSIRQVCYIAGLEYELQDFTWMHR